MGRLLHYLAHRSDPTQSQAFRPAPGPDPTDRQRLKGVDKKLLLRMLDGTSLYQPEGSS
jgi:hypothetical protein